MRWRATQARADRGASRATSPCSPRSARRTPTVVRADEWTQWLQEDLGRGRVEGDHGSTRRWHRRLYRFLRRDAHRARSPRSPRRSAQDRVRGANEGSAGVVHQVVRPVGEPRQHPARRGDCARDASPRFRGDTLKEVLLGNQPAAADDVESMSAPEILRFCLDSFPGRVSLACSFQKEETVLLDMLLAIDPKARVFAIDTHYLFPETYELWRKVEQRYDLEGRGVRGPGAEELTARTATASGRRNPTSTWRSPRSSR